MLKCKDFDAVEQTESLAIVRKFEPLESVLDRINAWVSAEKIKVLNVETIFTDWAYGVGARTVRVRVWYEE